jgi:hypothetical protein
MLEADVGIEPRTVLFLILQSCPKAVWATEKNIRRPNYNKPPEDGGRYNRKGHYHGYKFPIPGVGNLRLASHMRLFGCEAAAL